MTLEHEPDTGHDDRELDAFLRGEDALSSLLADVEQPAPPPALDARIHAQARAALGAGTAGAAGADTGSAAANDAAPAAAPAWARRMRTPLALAATVVLGVSLGLRWEGWHGKEAAMLSDLPAGAAAPGTPAPTAAPVPSLPPAVPQQTPAPTRPAQSARTPSGRAGLASAPSVPPPVAPVAAPMVAAPPPPAPAPGIVDGIVAEDVGALPPADVLLRSSNRAAGRIRPAPPPPVSAPAPAIGPVVPEPAPAAVPPRTPAEDARARQWLALLGTLLDRGLDADALNAWRQFRAEFPDTPVPPALQSRIDALQGASAR